MKEFVRETLIPEFHLHLKDTTCDLKIHWNEHTDVLIWDSQNESGLFDEFLDFVKHKNWDLIIQKDKKMHSTGKNSEILKTWLKRIQDTYHSLEYQFHGHLAAGIRIQDHSLTAYCKNQTIGVVNTEVALESLINEIKRVDEEIVEEKKEIKDFLIQIDDGIFEKKTRKKYAECFSWYSEEINIQFEYDYVSREIIYSGYVGYESFRQMNKKDCLENLSKKIKAKRLEMLFQ